MSAAVAFAPSIVNRGVHLHPLSLNNAPTKALVGASLKGYSLHCIIFRTATDPCMGSGHILVYAFDVLMQIYESAGYTQRDAAKSILEHNLYGLDIDDRAFQLAYFAVMMKARQYNRRILNGETDCHVYAIIESNWIGGAYQYEMGNFLMSKEHQETLNYLLDAFKDAKEYGSILQLEDRDYAGLMEAWKYTASQTTGNFNLTLWYDAVEKAIPPLIEQAIVLSQKYDVVVTNPPYMASSNMNNRLADYVKEHYSAAKADLYGAFILKCGEMTRQLGLYSMITQHTWMFLGSYEELRSKILMDNLCSMAHFGIKAFEEIGNDVVQTCAFVICKEHISMKKATFCRLIDYKDYQQKEREYHNSKNYYKIAPESFKQIPGIIFAYWVSAQFISNFSVGRSIEAFGEFTGSQNITGNNEKYLRCYWEVSNRNIGTDYWTFYAKGGDYRKYYGNLTLVVDWRESGKQFYRTNKTSNLLNERFWFKEGITYSAVTSRGTGFRYLPKNCIFDKGGPSISINRRLSEIIALLNSKVAEQYFLVFNPSINLQVKDIKAFPIILPTDDELKTLADKTIEFARDDWNSFETSYSFSHHPLISNCSRVQDAYEKLV